MTFQLKVKPKAEEDIALGRDYYQEIRPQLAIDFLLEIDRCIELILSNPLRRAVVFKDIRRLHLKRFPYVISYFVEGDLAIVIAVTHNRRQSREWKVR
jgi:toxin ParE1/3/4